MSLAGLIEFRFSRNVEVFWRNNTPTRRRHNVCHYRPTYQRARWMAFALQRRRVMVPQPQTATGLLSFSRDGAHERLGVTAFRAFLVNSLQRCYALRFWRFNLYLSASVSGAAHSQTSRAMALAALAVSRCVLVPQPQIARRAKYLPLRTPPKETERNSVYQKLRFALFWLKSANIFMLRRFGVLTFF